MFITLSVASAENISETTDLNIDVGDYESTAVSTEIIEQEEVTKNIVTNKTASKISIDTNSVKYNTTTNFKAKITDSEGKNITEGKTVFKINGRTIGYSEVKDGIASLTYSLTNMTPKTYNLSVKYAENSKYLESIAYTNLTLLKHDSIIEVNDVNVITRDIVNITAKVTDIDYHDITSGGKVAFKINGKTVGYSNVTDGIASYSYDTTKLSAKLYNITATFGGNYLLNSDVSKAGILNVSAIPTRMTVNQITGYSTTVTLKATVVEKINSVYLPSGIVVFKINDKTIGNTTISNGKASLVYNTANLARGNYKISAFLKPTSTYATTNASNNLTILAEDYFTFDQIRSAAIEVRTQYEANKNVTTVYIGKSRIALSELLALMIQTVNNVNNNKGSEKVPYVHYKTLTTQTDSLTKSVLNMSQILEIGERTFKFMQTNGRPPKYVSTEFGLFGYYNIVYTYTRILDVSTSSYLVSTCRVYNWNSIHPSNPKVRTIYITSDVIYNSQKDNAFMNSIKSKLESYGYTVVIEGYGPNSHVNSIWNQSLPDNAVQLSIFGGADAGVINDICTRSFMRYKESRMMFLAYYSNTSKDITGLKFLERAHDDNYSLSSFKGLDYPDIYLKNHGYDYVYTNSVNTIVKKLIEYIS